MNEILSFIGFAYVPVSLCILTLYAIHYSSKIDKMRINIEQIYGMTSDIHFLTEGVNGLNDKIELLTDAVRDISKDKGGI